MALLSEKNMSVQEQARIANEKFAKRYITFEKNWKKEYTKSKKKARKHFENKVLDELWEKMENADPRWRMMKSDLLYVDKKKYNNAFRKCIDLPINEYNPMCIGLVSYGEDTEERILENLNLIPVRGEKYNRIDQSTLNENWKEYPNELEKAYAIKKSVLNNFGTSYLKKKVNHFNKYLNQEHLKLPFVTKEYIRCTEKSGKSKAERKYCDDIFLRQTYFIGKDSWEFNINILPKPKDFDF